MEAAAWRLLGDKDKIEAPELGASLDLSAGRGRDGGFVDYFFWQMAWADDWD